MNILLIRSTSEIGAFFAVTSCSRLLPSQLRIFVCHCAVWKRPVEHRQTRWCGQLFVAFSALRRRVRQRRVNCYCQLQQVRRVFIWRHPVFTATKVVEMPEEMFSAVRVCPSRTGDPLPPKVLQSDGLAFLPGAESTYPGRHPFTYLGGLSETLEQVIARNVEPMLQ